MVASIHIKRTIAQLTGFFINPMLMKLSMWLTARKWIGADTLLNGGTDCTDRQIADRAHKKNRDPVWEVPTDVVRFHATSPTSRGAAILYGYAPCTLYALQPRLDHIHTFVGMWTRREQGQIIIVNVIPYGVIIRQSLANDFILRKKPP